VSDSRGRQRCRLLAQRDGTADDACRERQEKVHGVAEKPTASAVQPLFRGVRTFTGQLCLSGQYPNFLTLS